jgi:hypothetical protein
MEERSRDNIFLFVIKMSIFRIFYNCIMDKKLFCSLVGDNCSLEHVLSSLIVSFYIKQGTKEVV